MPAPFNLKRVQQGKLDAIDHAVQHLEIESFADLGSMGQVYGQYAFHTMEKPGVQSGVLVDIHLNDWVKQQIARYPGLRAIEGNFTEPQTIGEVGNVDAVLLFDVLLHTVAPDWDELLHLYAPSTRAFVIANPQWEGGERTIRLIDLGRDRYLEAVPPSDNHSELFDRLGERAPGLQRPWRDAMYVWQWGITDADLTAKMAAVGFELTYESTLQPFWNANGFMNKAFVFSR